MSIIMLKKAFVTCIIYMQDSYMVVAEHEVRKMIYVLLAMAIGY